MPHLRRIKHVKCLSWSLREVVSNICQQAVSPHVDSLLVPHYHLHPHVFRSSFCREKGFPRKKSILGPSWILSPEKLYVMGKCFVCRHLSGPADSTPRALGGPSPPTSDCWLTCSCGTPGCDLPGGKESVVVD